MAIIEVSHLHRTFIRRSNHLFNVQKKTIVAVRDLSFRVTDGEIFGLLGQNGAGKTTTIKILTTMLLPTSGSAKVLDMDVAKKANAIRAQINFIFGGELGLYRRLSARDNLRYFCNLYKLPGNVVESTTTQLLDLVGLSNVADARVETYSKGMAQKLQIARGLVNHPRILFMDEPTLGLDALAVKTLHAIILRAKNEGTTIFLTTHDLHEAEKLCDQLIIINHGEMVAQGSVRHVIAKAATTYPDQSIVSLEDAYISLIQGGETRV